MRYGLAYIALVLCAAGCSGTAASEERHAAVAEWRARVEGVGVASAREVMDTSVYVRDHRTSPPSCYLFARDADHPASPGGRGVTIAAADCDRVKDRIQLEYGQ